MNQNCNRVSYVEPNYINSDLANKNSFGEIQIASNLEDYCVVVNFQVEVPSKPIQGQLKKSERVINVVFSTSTSGDADTKISYLTTAPTELGTFLDIQKGPSHTAMSESFGINSINIEYNNYMVPCVTVQFTDIRGTSLFAPEELRHNKIHNGVSASVNDDIEGSFFKCFFTFPYPRFKIIVKGFYGNPVTYDLTCSDFRASFDASTGNFGATARFIGYSFSLLNDITLPSIIAAPYSELYGREYWERNVKDGTFTFEDKNGQKVDMITLIDLVEKVPQLAAELNKLSQQLTADMSTTSNNYKPIHDAIYNYIEKLISVCVEDNIPYAQSIDKNSVILHKNSDICSKVKTEYEVLMNALYDIETLNEKLTSLVPKPTYGLQMANENSIKKDNLDFVQNDAQKVINENQFYYFAGSKITRILNKIYNDDMAQKELSNNELVNNANKGIVDLLGFEPNVYNVTKLILAHVDTFVNELVYCASTVKTSNSNNASWRNSNGYKCAFPQIVVPAVSSTALRAVSSWPGAVDMTAPEVQLVESLLQASSGTVSKAVVSAQKIIEQSEQAINGVNLMKTSNLPYPLCISDLIGHSDPFNFNSGSKVSIEDIKRALLNRFLALRAFQILQNSSCFSTASEKIGRVDALNYLYCRSGIDSCLAIKIDQGSIKEEISDMVEKLYTSENIEEWYGLKLSETNENVIINPAAIPLKPYIDGTNTKLSDMKSLSNLYGYNGFIMSNFNNRYNKNNFYFDEEYEKYSSVELPVIQTNSSDSIELSNIGQWAKAPIQLSKYDFSRHFSDFHIPFCIRQNINITYSQSTNYKGIIPQNPENNDITVAYVKFDDNGCMTFMPNDDINNEKTSIAIEMISNDTMEVLLANPSNINNSHQFNRFLGILSVPGGKDFIKARTKKCSIFASKVYMEVLIAIKRLHPDIQNQILSILFLSSLPYESDYHSFRMHNSSDVTSDKPYEYWPYLRLVQSGARCWAASDENNKIIQSLEISDAIKDILNGYLLMKTPVEKGSDHYKFLIKIFNEWATKTCYPKVRDKYELRDVNNEPITNLNDVFERFEGGVTIKSGLLNKSFFDNYMAIGFELSEKGDKYGSAVNASNNIINPFGVIEDSFIGYILYHRNTNDVATTILNQFFKPCFYVEQITRARLIYDWTKVNDFSEHSFKSYISGFIDELIAYKDNNRNNFSNNNKIETTKTSVDVKIALYDYCKTVWDKWLSANINDNNDRSTSMWALNNALKKWHFIDSYYQDIKYDINIDVFDLVKRIVQAFTKENYSALSLISHVYAASNCLLVSIQNFEDMSKWENMSNMFKPVSFGKIDFNNLDVMPNFIVMYTNKPSTVLGTTSDSVGDSFMIGAEPNRLPKALQSNTDGKLIPAFGVTYGGQYQSFFKDINVSMEKPQVTDQSLNAQFAIASAAVGSQGKEGGYNFNTIGQDLYSIYANVAYTCTVTMMGCAWVQPLMYFQLNNIPLFRGSYLIYKVTHKITPGYMETVFTGTRMSSIATPFVKDNIMIGHPVSTHDAESVSTANGDNEATCENCQYEYYAPDRNVQPFAEALLMSVKKSYGGDDIQFEIINNNKVIVARGNNPEKLAIIMQLASSTYDGFITKMYWGVDGDNFQELPSMVYIYPEANKGANNATKIAVVNITNDNLIVPNLNVSDVNDRFLLLAKNRYGDNTGKIPAGKLNILMQEFVNFIGVEKTVINDINNRLNK